MELAEGPEHGLHGGVAVLLQERRHVLLRHTRNAAVNNRRISALQARVSRRERLTMKTTVGMPRGLRPVMSCASMLMSFSAIALRLTLVAAPAGASSRRRDLIGREREAARPGY